MKLQVDPATGVVRPTEMEGKTWEKVSRATKRGKIMIFGLKFMKKDHSAST
jgi:hypothetical protein